MTLPAFAAERHGARLPPLQVDISCPHGAQQQTAARRC